MSHLCLAFQLSNLIWLHCALLTKPQVILIHIKVYQPQFYAGFIKLQEDFNFIWNERQEGGALTYVTVYYKLKKYT